jgi:hypothetical protein
MVKGSATAAVLKHNRAMAGRVRIEMDPENWTGC